MPWNNRKKKNKKKDGESKQLPYDQRPRPPTDPSAEKKDLYETIVKENELFEYYYKLQNLVPESEFQEMMDAFKRSLPATFRITSSLPETKAMLHIVEEKFIKDVIETAKNNNQTDINPFPLPFYPNKLAWQVNLSRKEIRKTEAYFKLHNFLVHETESGYISRQEAVSMIPPLVLKVEPHHKILDFCAAPGSKTAQLMEGLHSNGEKNPKGFLIANDIDNKRCYMLSHQLKRLQSTATIVTNLDGANFPSLVFPDEKGNLVPIKYDRILCDVPCSGDGTLRKNVDLWKKFNPMNAFGLHKSQYQILKRGIELLKIGGKLVYSTCSLNPIEDEAVVARLLRDSKGSIELEDIDLPNLKYSPGISHWVISSRDKSVFKTPEEIPVKMRRTMKPCLFPPTPEEASTFNLNKCIRVLPHFQDTGGFFVALITKTKKLPWEGKAKEKEEDDGDEEEKDNINMDVDDAEEEKNGSSTSEKKDYIPLKKKRKLFGYNEEPFVSIKDESEFWKPLKDFYGLNLQSTQLLCRSEKGTGRNIYVTSEIVRDIINHNRDVLKIINTGVKAFTKTFDKLSDCNFRITNDGTSMMVPHMTKRIIKLSLEEMLMLLPNDNTIEPPVFGCFEKETQEQLKDIPKGSVILVAESQINKNEPKFNIELAGWRGSISLRIYIHKSERIHYIRLLGGDLSKFEINKFEEKEKQESEKSLITEEEDEKPDNGNSIEDVNEPQAQGSPPKA